MMTKFFVSVAFLSGLGVAGVGIASALQAAQTPDTAPVSEGLLQEARPEASARLASLREDAVSGNPSPEKDAALEARVQHLENLNSRALDALKTLKTKLSEKDDELLRAQRQLSKTISDLGSCKAPKAAKSDARAKLADKPVPPKAEAKIEPPTDLVNAPAIVEPKIEQPVQEPSQDLAEAKLRQEALEAKFQALLGQLGAESTRKKPAAAPAPARVAPQQQPVASPSTFGRRIPAGQQPQQPAGNVDLQQPLTKRNEIIPRGEFQSDVPIATVIEKKANLRSGPGEQHAPVMQVDEGSRLTVEVREGDWYQVISPAGTRLYIRADMVRLSDSSNPIPKKPKVPAVRVTDDDSVDGGFFGELPAQSSKVDAGSQSSERASKESIEEENLALEALRSGLKPAGN